MMDAVTTTLNYEHPVYIDGGISAPPHPPSDAPTQPLVSPLKANIVSGTYSPIQPWNDFAAHYAKVAILEFNPALWPDEVDGPSREALVWAKEILGALEAGSVVPTRVVASAEGGVAICFVHGEKYADIECLNSGEILGVTSSGHDKPAVWQLEQSARGINGATNRIRAFLVAPPSKTDDSGRPRG